LGAVGRAAAAASAGAQVDASVLYAKNCAKCHGKDGRARSFRGKLSGARDLTSAEWQARVSDETLFVSIVSGRGAMPSFKKKLSADEIKSLVARVRQFRRS
jgi:mono/diheme cytochrome c family protein